MSKNLTWGNNTTTFSGAQKKPEPVKVKTGKEIIHTPIQKLEDEIIFENPWLKVRRNGGFIYSERKGVDSIAFILIDSNKNSEKRIGLIHEVKDPIHQFLTTAFGGSIDDVKYHADLRVLVQDEVIEEAGFEVSLDDISYHGKIFVSTQQNQFTHLFSVNVDKNKQVERTTKNPTELLSKIEWLNPADLKILQDWKAITIFSRISQI